MTDSANTLFLRLAGPMQSWGTSSRFQLRRTDAYPSKSGVMGILLCAMGINHDKSAYILRRLNQLQMGVRVDFQGYRDWDYHTAGAGIGIRTAEGKIKRTASTKEYETLLSRREYLYDASFLIALQGDDELISMCLKALEAPVWTVFLGRKCCVPTEPVFAGTGQYGSLREALESIPWRPRSFAVDGNVNGSKWVELDAYLEHQPGTAPPPEASTCYDVSRGFGFYSHAPRWIVPHRVNVPVGPPMYPSDSSSVWKNPYAGDWEKLRAARIEYDNGLCVFCKSPAVDVHHTDYDDVRVETLRSLCKLCHDACTILEYSKDGDRRVDPLDPKGRPVLLEQIQRLLSDRRLPRRRELLEAGRQAGREIR